MSWPLANCPRSQTLRIEYEPVNVTSYKCALIRYNIALAKVNLVGILRLVVNKDFRLLLHLRPNYIHSASNDIHTDGPRGQG